MILIILVVLLARYSFSFCLVKDGEVPWQITDAGGLVGGLIPEWVLDPTGVIIPKDGNGGVQGNPFYEPFPWWDFSVINIWSYNSTAKTWIILQSIGYGWGSTAEGASSLDRILSGIPTISGDPNNIANLENMCPGIKNNQGPPPPSGTCR